MKSIALAMTAAVLLPVSAVADGLPRLPRSVFDVIPPPARITGARGEMQIYQSQCRIGPTHWARRRIVDIAVQEWAFFGFQTIDATQVESHALAAGIVPDTDNPARPPHIVQRLLRVGAFEDEPEVSATIAGYWSATPDGQTAIDEENAAWNAPGGRGVNWLEPWSAAFVSWVMCEAGLGDMNQFHRSIAHWANVDQAIAARDALDKGEHPASAYIAYDPGDKRLSPGDLLCSSREDVEYRNLADRRAHMGDYAPMHCDIVVAVPDDNRALVIGGNVLQSVTLTILPLGKAGKLYPHPLGANEVAGAVNEFAHLVLQADPVEANPLPNSPTLRALKRNPPPALDGPPSFLSSPAP